MKLPATQEGDVWMAWDDRREERGVVRLARIGSRGIERVHAVTGEQPAIAAAGGVTLVWRTRDGSAHALQVKRGS